MRRTVLKAQGRYAWEVLELQREWRQVVEELEEGRKTLEVIVTEGEERIKAIEEAKAGACTSMLTTRTTLIAL